MLDIKQFIALPDAATHFPVRPHIGTLMRWALKGVGPHRVKLKTWKVCGRRFTTRAAIEQFVERLGEEPTATKRLSVRRTESIAEDERQLDAEGIV